MINTQMLVFGKMLKPGNNTFSYFRGVLEFWQHISACFVHKCIFEHILVKAYFKVNFQFVFPLKGINLNIF